MKNKNFLPKLPLIIGHRGVAAYAPENTLEGIHTAADMGVEWVELDVKLTQDDVPIIFHDDSLERTTNGSGTVASTRYSEIKELDSGSWFSESFTGIKVPTLEEAISVLIDRNLGLNLEIKPCPGREKETAEIALDILSQYWDDHDRLLISSFSHVSLEVAHDMAQDWARGLLLDTKWPDNWQELADYLNVSSVNIDGNNCSQDNIEAIIDEGYLVAAYTINAPQTARKLQSWGVDTIFTDAPDVVRDGLLTVH